jgi:hypothetical protein
LGLYKGFEYRGFEVIKISRGEVTSPLRSHLRVIAPLRGIRRLAMTAKLGAVTASSDAKALVI